MERSPHPTAVVNDALFNLSSGEITVGEYAFFGHGVGVLTGTRDVTAFDRVRQVAVPKSGRDVRADVPPYAVVGGVPACVLSTIAERPS